MIERAAVNVGCVIVLAACIAFWVLVVYGVLWLMR